MHMLRATLFVTAQTGNQPNAYQQVNVPTVYYLGCDNGFVSGYISHDESHCTLKYAVYCASIAYQQSGHKIKHYDMELIL